MKTWSRDDNLLIFILFLVLLEGILFFYGNFEANRKEKLEEIRLAKIEQVFSSAEILAKTFSVYDGTDKKEIYNKNGDQILPLASLSKIMTAVVALEKYNINDTLTIIKKSEEENKNNALSIGEKWKVGDLIKFTLISSSNTGAFNLAQNDQNYLNEMNKKGKFIGMQNSVFSNFTGLDINNKKAGAYGKALDINLLSIFAIENYPQIFDSTILNNSIFKSKSGFIHKVKNTNIIVQKIPNLIFSKTGFTTLAGGNLAIIFKSKMNHNIAITLLGSTEAGRFSDMEKLVEIAYNLDYGTAN